METNNKDSSLLDSILSFLLLPVVTFLFLLNIALPAKLTWNLFIPTFFGLPVLTIPTALMIVLTVAMFTVSRTHRTDDTRSQDTKNTDVLLSLMPPWIVYVLAFLTYKFFIV